MKYCSIIFFLITFLLNQENISLSDSIESDIFQQDLFESLLTEAKMFYADAIIADLIGDTLDAMYQFDNAFKCPKVVNYLNNYPFYITNMYFIMIK